MSRIIQCKDVEILWTTSYIAFDPAKSEDWYCVTSFMRATTRNEVSILARYVFVKDDGELLVYGEDHPRVSDELVVLRAGGSQHHPASYRPTRLPDGDREIWITKDGRRMLVSHMTDEHVGNLFIHLERSLYKNRATSRRGIARAQHRIGSWIKRVNDEIERRQASGAWTLK